MANVKQVKPKQDNRKPIQVYTQGDDVIANGEVKHFVTATSGTDTRTQDNVVAGPIASMTFKQIGAALRRFHKKHNGG